MRRAGSGPQTGFVCFLDHDVIWPAGFHDGLSFDVKHMSRICRGGNTRRSIFQPLSKSSVRLPGVYPADADTFVGFKSGEQELPGLTDEEKPRLRGPKRASKIRKLFNLTKDDDVRKYVNTYRKVRLTALHRAAILPCCCCSGMGHRVLTGLLHIAHHIA